MITDSQELFSGHGIRVTLDTAELPDGTKKTVARAHRADVAHILAFTAEGKMLLLKEFRPFFGAHIWMIPSGHVDRETDITEAAQRELREETGYRAETLTHVATAGIAERLVTQNHFFLASGLVHDPLPQDEDERIEVHEVDPDEALRLIRSSKVVHLASEYAVLRYLHDKVQKS